ncbi:MAG: dihydroorotase [archaeon GW2011_AR3]|nr:MAG: dihydroorotase [archaeon GW2011_AR3]
MLVIKNARVLSKGKLTKKNIIVEGSRIKKVSNSLTARKNIIDVKGKIVLPGLIDPHVHMREPGFEYKEDFFSGSKAAAAGGITTFLDMPNNRPPITSVAALNVKRNLATKSIVNYGFHFGTDGDNIGEIQQAWKSNIASVKIFMDESTGKMTVTDHKKIKQVFENSKAVAVHAEGKNVETAMAIAKSTGTMLYLCHLSSREEMAMLHRHKMRNVFAEATPHHLFLTSADANQYNTMKPFLKPKDDQNALWEAIKKGLIHTIGTDHAPHTAPEKELGTVYGVPGLETVLPLMLDAVNKKKISLDRLVELTSENPARIFKIKGRSRGGP